MSDIKIYAVAKGVEWVAGKRVPKDRRVSLTEAEAEFDLGYARIALDDEAMAKLQKDKEESARKEAERKKVEDSARKAMEQAGTGSPGK